MHRNLDLPRAKQIQPQRAGPSNARSRGRNLRTGTGFPTRRRIGPPFGSVNAHLLEPRFPQSLRLEEIRQRLKPVVRVLVTRSRDGRAEHSNLARKLSRALRFALEARADLEQAHRLGALSQIVRARAQQARDEIRAQHFSLATHGIRQANRRRALAEEGARGVGLALRDQSRRPRLGDSTGEHRSACARDDPLARAPRRERAARVRRRLGNAIVSKGAPDLFDQVVLERDVGSPARHAHRHRIPALDSEIHCFELPARLVGVHGQPQQARASAGAKPQGSRLRRGVIASARGGLTNVGRHLAQQAQEAGRGREPDLRIHPALVASRGLRGQSQLRRAAAHATWLEPGAFEQDRGRLVRDLGVRPSHHAGDRHRTALVGDDQDLGVEGARLAVERDERLPLPRAPHANRGTLELPQVEGVKRLSELEQDEIRGIHHVVDRALPHRRQAADDRARRGPDPDLLHDLRQVARTAFAILELEVEVAAPRPSSGQTRARGLGPATGETRADLARQAHHAEPVGTVEGHFHFEHRIRGSEKLCQRTAERERGADGERGEIEDALVLLGQAELARGAEHPLALLAPDLARPDHRAVGQPGAHRGERGDHPGMDVGGAAHHTDLARAAVHPAEREPVGVRMPRHLEHARHDHPGIVAAPCLDPGDVEAAHGEARGDPIGVALDHHPVAEPGKRKLHR